MVTTAKILPTKTARNENFPVGSWLLPSALRPHIAIFYAFARAADDIADSADLPPAEKIERLEALEAALTGTSSNSSADLKAQRMGESLAATGVTHRHCFDLLAAFKQDATKNRYRNWRELMDYCALSAAPVGRYLLDLHGESSERYRYSDGLCAALQVLNHLQDCQNDYRQLDRVYLPLDWLEERGCRVEDLDGSEASVGVRAVLDRCLSGVEDLLDAASALPHRLGRRRLAMEASVILRLARRLMTSLRESDPIAARVRRTKRDFLCGLSGIKHALFNAPKAEQRPSNIGHRG